jgi:nicotinate phosphoribosyltransferase
MIPTSSTQGDGARGKALFTDLYELTMLRAYGELGMEETAVFSLFVRSLPRQRNFLLACGLDDLLGELETLRFEAEDIVYLASLGHFTPDCLDRLSRFRFTGDVYAMAEGTPLFANEPILEIVAPVAEAQLVETLVLNQIGLQTLLASKAIRTVLAARGRSLLDFGTRRAQGFDAAIKGARAFHIAGVAATSNVMAGKVYGIPVAGTMAHSFIEACASEFEAFRSFAGIFPETTLLVDTYDTPGGVDNVLSLARELGPAFGVRAIRLDSGDLAGLARDARARLDAAGHSDVQIVASGGLDEYAIDRLMVSATPIDMFGVGTEMSVSGDAPAIDIVYKLTEYAGTGRMKFSTQKQTLPGRKQVFREFRDGKALRDTIARHGETGAGTPLLQPVMRQGKRLAAARPLAEIRNHVREAVAALPAALHSLAPAGQFYAVAISPVLAAYEREVRETVSDPAREQDGARHFR